MQVEFGWMEKLNSWHSEMNNYYTDYSKEQISGFDTPQDKLQIPIYLDIAALTSYVDNCWFALPFID